MTSTSYGTTRPMRMASGSFSSYTTGPKTGEPSSRPATGRGVAPSACRIRAGTDDSDGVDLADALDGAYRR